MEVTETGEVFEEEKSTRKKGYYWVRIKEGMWEIAFFDTYDNVWDCIGMSWFNKDITDKDFEEIDENQIVRK